MIFLNMEEVNSKCGVFGAHSLHDVYNGLKALQHRGQDASGIACLKKNGSIDILRWEGLVTNFDLQTATKLLDGGHLFIGEIRYSTNKGKTSEEIVGGALPRYLGGKVTSRYEFPYLSHIIVRNANYALAHNGHFRGFTPRGKDTDTDVALKFYSLQQHRGIEKIIETFPAAYSCALLDSSDKDKIQVFKDRYSIRPLWIGEKDGKLIASSENRAIAEIGGRPLREVCPGEIVDIHRSGTEIISKQVIKREKRPCFFERVYLGHPDSIYQGISNQDTRRRGGVALIKELQQENFDFDSVDFISYVPNSPQDSARAAADYLDIPLYHVFYKINPKRAFLSPNNLQRNESIKSNLCINDQIDIEGKRGLFIDDSIVRFNNAKDVAQKLDERSMSWKGLLVLTPPIGPIKNGIPCGCEGGVDMPPDDDFAIRRYDTIERMASDNNWDLIHYLSHKSLEDFVLRRPLSKCCARCIGLEDPVFFEDLKDLNSVVSKVYENYKI